MNTPLTPDDGSGLRERTARWLFHKVTRRDGLTKLQWEHLEQPQRDGWLEWADELLAPMLALADEWERYGFLNGRHGAQAAARLRHALDGGAA